MGPAWLGVQKVMSYLNVEIGGHRGRKGWVNLDHDSKYAAEPLDLMFDELPFKDKSVDFFYMANVIEHIPYCKVNEVLRKLYAKLKPGGRLRLTTPDLRAYCQAYINGDAAFLERVGPRRKLYKDTGIGGMLMQSIVSYGADGDTFLFDRTKKREITALAHVGLYDWVMLSNVLMLAGFSSYASEYDTKLDPQEEGQVFAEARA